MSPDANASYQDIRYAAEGGVATITIDRPHRLNAFTGKTLDELHAALSAASADRAVGIVVLTGAGGRAFCAGGDMDWEV